MRSIINIPGTVIEDVLVRRIKIKYVNTIENRNGLYDYFDKYFGLINCKFLSWGSELIKGIQATKYGIMVIEIPE